MNLKAYSPFVLSRKLYDWTLKWAEHQKSVYALSLLAMAESIFFPVPADVLLMVMGAAKPKKALSYGIICSLSSVLGGVFGYLIGYMAWQAVDGFFLTYVFSPELFQKVGMLYEENAFWSVFTAAFTPIPFKVFTVAAGVFEISFLPFLLAASLGRPLRFMIVSGLLYFFGASIKDFVDKYFNLVTIAFTVLLIGGFVFLKYL